MKKKLRVLEISMIAICVIMLRGATASPAQAQNAEPLKISMNFQDTDIHQIIGFIRDITGKVVVVDEQVKGTITIVAQDTLSVDEAMRVLSSALKAKGFTMVSTDQVTRIVPVEESRQTNVETRIGKNMDDVPEDDKVITQVIPLERAQAATVRADLKSMVGASGEILHSESSNSLIITDAAANIKRLLTIINYIDADSVTQKQIKVFTLDYARSPDIAALLSQLPKNTDIPVKDLPGAPKDGSIDESPVRLSGELTVLADERSNSILVATPPSNFPAVEKIVRSLDRMLSQVLIETIIMEVTLTDTTKIGMEWYFEKFRSINGENYSAQSSLDLNLDSENFGVKTNILKEGGALELLNFLLKTEEKINILSTPMIMTSDNKEASINVGTEVPYLKETRRSTGDTKDYVYDYRDVGIGLKVTPHINSDRYIVLDIHQEIKKLGPQTLFDAFIVISRTADASLIIKDRQTVVLGGLMRDDKTRTKSKVPILGDLPLVGNAFSKTSVETEKTELLVFITPYIITNAEEMEEVTQNQKDHLKKLSKD